MATTKVFNYHYFALNQGFFLHDLSSVRKHTFRRTTVLSAWQVAGVRPWNPALVLDAIVAEKGGVGVEGLQRFVPSSDEDSDGRDDEEGSRGQSINAGEVIQAPEQPAVLVTPTTTRHMEDFDACIIA